MSNPIELPATDNTESLLADFTSEQIVAHIGRLALICRHFRIVGRDDYVRDVQVDIDIHTSELRSRGDEHLLEAEEQKSQATPPVAGAKGVLGHI